jgi:predicted small lipoprotein YifL
MMKHSHGGTLAAVLLASLAATGCGLKGALTMPSKSDEVVIRAPAQAAPADGATTATPPATAPAEPAKEAPAKKPPKDDRVPPPPLPGGNPGTVRGG